MRKLVLLAVFLSLPALAYDINVKNHGAVGDGTTNDTPAIQGALNAAAALPGNEGVVVYFPRGTYRLYDTLHIPSGHRFVLRGAGYAAGWGDAALGQNTAVSVLRITDPNKDAIDATAISATITIEQLSFQGAGLQPEPQPLGTSCAIRISGAADARITRNWFNGFQNSAVFAVGPSLGGLHNTHIADNGFELCGYGLRFERGYNNVIQGNRFYSIRVAGIALQKGDFVQIQNNHFDLIGRGAAMSMVPPEAAAILVKYSGSTPKLRELLISSNQFNQNGHDIVLNAPGGTYPGSDTGIANVFIHGNNSDVAKKSFLYVHNAVNTVISNNRIHDSSDDASGVAAIILNGSGEDAGKVARGSMLHGNVVTYHHDVNRPAYGLRLGPHSRDTILGVNEFNGTSAAVLIESGATLAPAKVPGTLLFAREPLSDATETGVAGLRFRAHDQGIAGANNVNFRQKRRVVPVVTLDVASCTRSNGQVPFVTNVTVDGFRFNLTSAGAGDVYAVECQYTVTTPP